MSLASADKVNPSAAVNVMIDAARQLEMGEVSFIRPELFNRLQLGFRFHLSVSQTTFPYL